jgi:hypothetical protein
VKPAITKTKKAAIPAANGRSIARAIAKNETEKAAAIAEASRLMNLPCIEEPPMERIFCVVVYDRSDLGSDVFGWASDPPGSDVLS